MKAITMVCNQNYDILYLHTVSTQNCKVKENFFYDGNKVLNSLSAEVRSSDTFAIYKNRLCAHNYIVKNVKHFLNIS